MHHETSLITTIVGGLVLAFVFGSIANRFKLPPLVGYLIAGVLVGPFTPGFVADQSLANQLSEIGVILLMFGVGLHFSLKDLMSVKALAIPGALVQIAFATVLGYGMAKLMGWPDAAGWTFGLALSVASTVVLLKAMQERRLIETERGRIAVGWLIVEDLAMVLALVLIPAFASLAGAGVEVHDPFISVVERMLNTSLNIYGVVAVTVVKLAAFAGFMLIVGRRVIPFILHATAHSGNRELFRLAVLAIALGVALGSSYLFGVSLALGAFFAGMILSESELSQRAAQETLPLRDAFAVLFFVSVGMLFDPMILINNPLPVIGTLFIILIGKSIAAFLIVVLFRRPVATALTISASLAQIGEFSFILATMGVQLQILPAEAQPLIVAGAILSIVLNPVMFMIVDRLRPGLEAKVQAKAAERGEIEPLLSPSPVLADEGDVLVTPEDEQETEVAASRPMLADDDLPQPTALRNHTILVGYGRVGRVVAEGLLAERARFLVIEDADARVAAARAKGCEVVVGNAASRDVLSLANVGGAACLLVAIPNAFEAGQVTDQGRRSNAGLRIIARAHSEDEEEHLKRLGADIVVMGEREIGLGMLNWLHGSVHADASAPAEPVEATVRLTPHENIVAAAVAAVSSGQPIAEAPVEVAAAAATLEPAMTTPDDVTTEQQIIPPASTAPGVVAAALAEQARTETPASIEGEARTVAVSEPEAGEADKESFSSGMTPEVIILPPSEPIIAMPPAPPVDVVAEAALSGEANVDPDPASPEPVAAEPAAPEPVPEPQPVETPTPQESPAPVPPVEEPRPSMPVEAPEPGDPIAPGTPQEAPADPVAPTTEPIGIPDPKPAEIPPQSPPSEVPGNPLPPESPQPVDPVPPPAPASPEIPVVMPERLDGEHDKAS